MKRSIAIRKISKYLNHQFKELKVGDKEAKNLLDFLEKDVGMMAPKSKDCVIASSTWDKETK